MTKEKIKEYLCDATERTKINIDKETYKYYAILAMQVGVSVDDYVSAVITQYIKELLNENKICM
jgi:predicted HicB family RNase H-like nuclease